MKVLVVDDERDIEHLFRQRFRREIREHQVEFVFAYSAGDALLFLAGADAADLVLILSDINMPGMSGLELLREIRQKDPKVKVFMITAYDDEEKQAQAVQFGANDYFTKPINFDSLKERILSVAEAHE